MSSRMSCGSDEGMMDASLHHAWSLGSRHSNVKAMSDQTDPDQPCSEVEVNQR